MVDTTKYNKIALLSVSNHLKCKKHDSETAYETAKKNGKTNTCCQMYKDMASLYEQLLQQLPTENTN